MADTFNITWGEVGERTYETGTDRGVLYLQNSSGAYPEGVAWNGLTGVDESPSGAEVTKLWADNINYLNLTSAEEFGATITAYTYPDEFAQCDGSDEPVDGMRIGQQERKHFGFCYRTLIGNDTEGNAHGYKIHCIYGCVAKPSQRSYKTVNDSPEAIEFSWEISTTPVAVTGFKPTATVELDSTVLSANAWAAVEEVLYGTPASGGTAAVPGRLPLPDELKTIITQAG